MNRIFRGSALVLALAGLGVWVAMGAHRGWTQTSVAVKVADEVTGIEAVQYRSGFVPGVDFMAGVLVASGALGAASLLFRNQQQTKGINRHEKVSA